MPLIINLTLHWPGVTGAFLPSPVIRFGCSLSCLLGTGKPPFLEEQKETWAVREGETEGEMAWLLFPAPQEEVVLGQSVLRPGHKKPGWLGTLRATPPPGWRQGVRGAELGARSRQAQRFLSGKAALLLLPQLLSWEGGSNVRIRDPLYCSGKLWGMRLPASLRGCRGSC